MLSDSINSSILTNAYFGLNGQCVTNVLDVTGHIIPTEDGRNDQKIVDQNIKDGQHRFRHEQYPIAKS